MNAGRQKLIEMEALRKLYERLGFHNATILDAKQKAKLKIRATIRKRRITNELLKIAQQILIRSTHPGPAQRYPAFVLILTGNK